MEMRDAIEIERPPEKVWEWLSDFEKKQQWMKGLLEEEWVEGPKGAKGSRFVVKIKEGPSVTPYEGKVLEAERPRHFRSSLTGGCGKEPMTMEMSYRLIDLGGRTQLEYECDAQMKAGPVLKLFMPLFAWAGRMQTRSFHKNLKKLVEAD